MTKLELKYSNNELKYFCKEIYVEQYGMRNPYDRFAPDAFDICQDYDGLFYQDSHGIAEGLNYNSEDFYDDRCDWLENIQLQLEHELVAYKRLIFNEDLFKTYCNQNNIIIDEAQDNQSLYDIFHKKLLNAGLCLPVKEYREELAYKCGLIPFFYAFNDETYYGPDGEIDSYFYNGRYLVMSGKLEESNMDFLPRFDAYQALINGTINPNSKLFEDRAYFEQVVGVDLTNEVLAAISRS